MKQIPNITLNNGVQMPQEGFGVFRIADLKQCQTAVQTALDTGYRLIDTAQAYYNEEAVGQAIADSTVNRQDIFLTTKVWVSNYGYQQTKDSLKESMQKLQTDYLDLVLLHQPFNDYYGAYHALEDLYQAGQIRAIGVSNFLPDRFVDLAEFNDVQPAVNQLETHVFYQQRTAQKYLDQYKTQLMAWGPLAQGQNDLFNNPTLVQIGQQHHKTAAQVALRYLIQLGIVIIPKSIHPDRMQQNLDLWDFALTPEQMQQIQKLDAPNAPRKDRRAPENVKFYKDYDQNNRPS